MSDPNFNFPALREAQGRLDAIKKQIADIFKQAGPNYDMAQVKGYGAPDDVVAKVRDLNDEAADLGKKIEELRNTARIAAQYSPETHEAADGAMPSSLKVESFESAFGKALNGAINRKHFAHEVKGVEVKTLFQRTVGWDPFDARDSRVELTPLRPAVHVINSWPSGTISQSDYKYMEETTHTATNTVELAEGATYGEAAFALTERSKPVEKIGAWVPVTDEQLEDEPAARAYLQSRLTEQIQRRLDSQLLVGDGSTPNLLGTETVSGIQTQAKGTDSIMDAALKLFTKIEDDGFARATVAFIRPSKWQEVLLTKTADGQYIWGHPSAMGPQALWGVPIVQTTAVTSTKLVAGDYATYAMFFLRRGMDVQVTNSHGTQFIEGKQAVRADIRAVAVHFRPKAFGTVTGL
jgi:hypothetical protein